MEDVSNSSSATSVEIERRKALLMDDIASTVAHYRALAKRNYTLNVGLLCSAIVVSLLGGVLGVLELASSKTVGALALLPGVIAAIAASLKMQTKANQYYRRKDALQFLHNYLTYDCPIPCTQEAISKVTAAWQELTERANKEFEDMAAPEWANVFAHIPKDDASQHSTTDRDTSRRH
ncbi:hypothetical protein AB3X91_17560 [Paraburkholderia sp. BR14263]|uniref:hypothetical protein n=1 Tax=unclassified Paraburkholderia TaxID=2615204 RepID=UPI0034D004AA